MGDPDVDFDSDQMSAFLEYALGSSDQVFSPEKMPVGGILLLDDGSHTGQLAEYLTLTLTRPLAPEDVIYEPQVSDDLVVWRGGVEDVVFVSRVNHGDGFETCTFRAAKQRVVGARQFIRLKVMER